MARSLARRVAAPGVEGLTVLEIGGGIGQVALELLEAGAASAEIVELVPEYEPHARELAREAGVGERLAFRTADLVVMNKVVCCTPDGIELAGIAASLTRRTLALSYPREAWWTRAALRLVNLLLRVRRRRFRVYLHPPLELEAAIAAHGLERASVRDGPLFRIAAFERT